MFSTELVVYFVDLLDWFVYTQLFFLKAQSFCQERGGRAHQRGEMLCNSNALDWGACMGKAVARRVTWWLGEIPQSGYLAYIPLRNRKKLGGIKYDPGAVPDRWIQRGQKMWSAQPGLGWLLLPEWENKVFAEIGTQHFWPESARAICWMEQSTCDSNFDGVDGALFEQAQRGLSEGWDVALHCCFGTFSVWFVVYNFKWMVKMVSAWFLF